MFKNAQVLKVRKQASNTAVARRYEVKETAEMVSKHILDVAIDCTMIIKYGDI
jgi:hypothetical protein